jgi:hypothetical protein
MDNTTAQATRASTAELIQQAIEKIRPVGKKQDGVVFIPGETVEAIELLELALEMIEVEKDAAFDRGVDYGLFNY